MRVSIVEVEVQEILRKAPYNEGNQTPMNFNSMVEHTCCKEFYGEHFIMRVSIVEVSVRDLMQSTV